MQKIFYVKSKSDGKIYSTEESNLEISTGDDVLFENDQGQEVGMVLPEEVVKELNDENLDNTKVTLIRKLTDKDRERVNSLKEEAKETLKLCAEKIEKHELEMTLLDADLSFDGKKLTFYFVAPGRIDFRSLVPDLAATFKKLIRLQQVGARDKAKCLGTLGRCGQKVCCKRFLKGDLESVTLDMAYEQNLGQMGSNRVTGACGKLMCCLKFELDYYCCTKKKMPELGSQIKTEQGKGIVKSQNILKKSVLVELDDKKIVEVNC